MSDPTPAMDKLETGKLRFVAGILEQQFQVFEYDELGTHYPKLIWERVPSFETSPDVQKTEKD